MSTRRRRAMASINVVPYIDVMLVLLVIFMITTPLLTQGVKVELPHAKARAMSAEQQQPLIVTVDKDGHYYLNVAASPRTPLSPRRLVTRIAAELRLAEEQRQKQQVFVRGDSSASYGVVVEAMALIQKAGVAQVGLMTSLPKMQQRLVNHLHK